MLIVQKFGGSSLKDPERLRHVAQLVRRAHEKAELAVVVSAMGGTTDSLAGRGADAAALSEAVLLLSGAGIAVLDGALGENVMTFTVKKEDHLNAMQILHREMILD